ncbi:MAG: Ppx/GppA family phosphatase [Planctomycetaceae bacterium]|jgi:exopolyphosphatase/guanosine-5'-triphosphate,3'-diphosphate pyrophosphatase
MPSAERGSPGAPAADRDSLPTPQATTPPLANGELVAFLDLGTNSVRLLLVRMYPDHTFTVVAEQKETVRLGEGEFRQNRLQPEAMRRASLVCAKFAESARSRGARQIVAVATSATREAENRGVFLRHLRRVAGIDVRVISGKEEARLIYLGVSSGLNLGARQTLFIDIGGGSTETIIGDQQQYRFLDSLKLGAIRLSGMFFRKDDTGPVSSTRYARIQRYVRTRSVRTLQRLRQFPIDQAVASSGTACNLAEITLRRTLRRGLQKGDVISRAQLRETVELLCGLPLAQRREVPGLNPERADIIIGGAAILETLLDELGLTEFQLSERGLREGLPIDYLSRSEDAHLFQQTSFRERSVFELGRRCCFDEAHARHVARIAWQLFDSAREAGLHTLGDWERELLEHASLLHDVGAFVSYTNHRNHSHYLIRNADLLGFDQTELAIIAATALFHHKSFPRPKHPEFAELDKPSRDIVRVLCTFLRIAESLDRSHLQAVADARILNTDRKTVRLELTPARDCHLELWEVRHHAKSFEKVFHRHLEFRVKDFTPQEPAI